jgi:hypothetical protein
MSRHRIKVIDLTPANTLFESVFTQAVGLVQATAVRSSVWIQNRSSSGLYDRWRSSAVELEPRLKDLGLMPERLWWGPMTLTPKKAVMILDEIERTRPKQVLEVGAGTSTAILAAAADRYGFSLLSLENHEGTIRYVDWLIGDLPCGNVLTIQKCGFRRYTLKSGRSYWWYNADLSMTEGPIDLMLVDGPMSTLVGRNGAVHATVCYLNHPNRVILDDCKRRHEKECVIEWISEYPGSRFETVSNVGMFTGMIASKSCP